MAKRRKRYKASNHAPITDDQAQVLGDVIEDIKQKTGQTHVKAEQLAAYAKPKGSPIHDMFVWNDAAAAGAYRVLQARKYLAYVKVVVRVNGKSQTTRAFHSVTVQVGEDDVETGYVSVQTIMKDKGLSDQVAKKALSEANRWRNRYREYADIFGLVFNEIDDIELV